jgi:alkylhydroperoxidase family enzyme
MTVRSAAVRDRVHPLEPYIQSIDEQKLSRREALALKLAGSLADAPYRLSDDLFAEVRTEFTPAEIVEMIFSCAIFSWGNIVGIGLHLDTAPDSPYGAGLDYVEGKRRKAGRDEQRTV